MDIVVTYDIADIAIDGGRRLRAVAEVCETFGVRSQFSVFECRVSDVGLARLIASIQDVIDPSKDTVHVYRMSGTVESCRTTIGRTKHHPVNKPWIL